MRMPDTGGYLTGTLTETGKDGKEIDIGKETSGGEKEDTMKDVKEKEGKEERNDATNIGIEIGTGTEIGIEIEGDAIKRTMANLS